METQYKIINVHGHYEGYINGKFICSGDSVAEVAKELEEELMSA